MHLQLDPAWSPQPKGRVYPLNGLMKLHVFWSSARLWHSHRNRHKTSQNSQSTVLFLANDSKVGMVYNHLGVLTKHASVQLQRCNTSNAEHLTCLQRNISEMVVYRMFSSTAEYNMAHLDGVGFWSLRVPSEVLSKCAEKYASHHFPCQGKPGSLRGMRPNNPTGPRTWFCTSGVCDSSAWRFVLQKCL